MSDILIARSRHENRTEKIANCHLYKSFMMEEDTPIPVKFRDLAYPVYRLNDHTLDENLPLFPCRSDANTTCHRPPTTSIGALDTIPLELLEAILCQLDLRTLADVRCVNRRGMALVDCLPQYKAITTNALNALHGILRIGTGRWISCHTLYEKLCTLECEQCGDFGGYLYLLTCKRVCFLCLSTDRLYLPDNVELSKMGSIVEDELQ